MSDVYLKVRHAKRQNAQNLDISAMNLTSVPEEVYALKTLLNLNMSKNNLSSLDKSIENMKNLIELNLEENQISYLPLEMTSLPNLKTVKINGNPIATKLVDWNLNWRESLKDYHKIKSISEETSNVNGNVSNQTDNISSQSKKAPFNFNMSNSKLNFMNNTFFNKKETPTGEIPKCVLFDNPQNEGKKIHSRILSASVNKREALNTILNSKGLKVLEEKNLASNSNNFIESSNSVEAAETNKANGTVDESNTSDNSKCNSDKEDIIKELKMKVTLYEEEIKQLKIFCDTKTTEIKILEDEVRNFKISNKEEKKVELSNKRNWMDDNISQPSSVAGNSNSMKTFIPTNEDILKDLETKLQKEEQQNKRLKNDIERLNSQMVSFKQNQFLSSESLIKTMPQIDLEEVQLGPKIGQGGFSIIHQAKWCGLPVAVKLIFDPNITEDLLNEFHNEIKMLFLLRHPNIVLLIGVSTKQKLAIITEFVPSGSLFELLHRSKKELTFEQKIIIIEQLIRALAFIHFNGVVHRDIKSYNVLVDENLNVKLCDFGLAKFKSDLMVGSGLFAGTPAYMAPELFQKKSYDEKIDLFAFGTLLWEILVRKIPYDGCEVAEIKNRILNNDGLFIPKTVPRELAAIIDACRAFDASKRPSFQELAKIQLRGNDRV